MLSPSRRPSLAGATRARAGQWPVFYQTTLGLSGDNRLTPDLQAGGLRRLLAHGAFHPRGVEGMPILQ